MKIKKYVGYLLKYFNVEVKKYRSIENAEALKSNIDERMAPSSFDLYHLQSYANKIPGMISIEAGSYLYTLVASQNKIEGDVIEIGSWQGRSTIFIAAAMKLNPNGQFFAIDHFKGNVGKEKAYFVNGQDIEKSLIANIGRINLEEYVNIINDTSENAIKSNFTNKIRFLFIDGDHTYQGVKTDIELFEKFLQKGSIVVFDDYSPGFKGVVDAAREFVNRNKGCIYYNYKNTLVVML
ncbi:class I SAM-dependent methyltransferase [Alphaproteobacteria bacterium]|nr:class I SAM-dependent methyltransferase [Alphaproteobacteria bacterium]